MINRIASKHGKTIALIAGLAVFATIVPMNTSAYHMTVLNIALFYFIAGLGLALLQGMGGVMSLGTFAFMGIGGFTTANLSKKLGFPTILSVILAVLFTTLVAYALSAVLLKLSGTYFVFSTMGFAQIMHSIFLNFAPLTGGADGVSKIPKLDLGPLSPKSLHEWYYILLFLAIVCGLIVENIRRTHLGRALASVRDNEIAAKSLGVNVFNTKHVAFTIAAALASLSGALLAHHNGFISFSLYDQVNNMMFIMMVMLGGVNSTLGIFFGALLVTMLPEWLRMMREYMQLFYGTGVILLMIFMPTGLAGLFSTLVSRVKESIVKEADDGDGESYTAGE